ncbi:HepT-like ribonuclease domain-containing protein [beta proteobacterium MWH-UniP1]
MAIKDIARIGHILEAAEDLSKFLEGKDRASLSSDKMLRYAVIRAIEIIGEASSQISAQTKASYPGLPWREAIGMRNELIHAYITVDEEIVWTTATIDIPHFVSEIKRVGLDQLKD